MKNLVFGFIGLGLIGGSIAKGLKKDNPEHYIMAYARHRSTLYAALAEETIDEALDGIDENISRCDYIFLCTPVSFAESYLTAIRPFLKEDAIITDVGSTKTSIHKSVEKLGLESHFIGGHPMAGSEKSGFKYSNDRLVENAYYILTPTKSSPQEKVAELRELALSLGALPLVLDYDTHDYIVAGISHLPHLIAASLVTLVKEKDTPSQTMKTVAAGGFKDITRIASSSPEMWQAICSTNREHITSIMDDYIASLQKIRDQVAADDSKAIFNLFDESREYRNSIPDRSLGPIKKDFVIYVDIPDRSGSIATVATILAAHQISIKNIGIIHNREFEEGVLKIFFYEQESLDLAQGILDHFNYKIHMKE